jgi:hypothetical protein
MKSMSGEIFTVHIAVVTYSFVRLKFPRFKQTNRIATRLGEVAVVFRENCWLDQPVQAGMVRRSIGNETIDADCTS